MDNLFKALLIIILGAFLYLYYENSNNDRYYYYAKYPTVFDKKTGTMYERSYERSGKAQFISTNYIDGTVKRYYKEEY